MASSQSVWVKRDGEGDEKALKVLVVPSADVSDLISVLYKEPYFAYAEKQTH
jgi:hypothetical protein